MGCSNSKDVKEPVVKTDVPEEVQAVECEAEASAEVAVDAPEEVTEAVEVEAVTETE